MAWKKTLISSLGLVVLLLLLVACGTTVEYTVRPGDTLLSIAKKYQTTANDIANANADRYPNLSKNPNSLTPGQVLRIPVQDEWERTLGQIVATVESRLEEDRRPTPALPSPSREASANLKLASSNGIILELINEARARSSLPNLRSEPTLDRIALTRSQDMISRSYFSHDDPATGHVAFEDLIKAYHFPFQFAGENIAEIRNEGLIVPSGLSVFSRYSDRELAQQFVTGWLNSREHRDNILNARFRRTGISVFINESGTRVVATQLFSD